jgi:cytochrome d ubiquinol oxidase subunit I
VDAPAVAGSLLAFAIVYLLVFGAGIYYLLQLMRRAPAAVEPGPERGLPQRAAGITPAPALEKP